MHSHPPHKVPKNWIKAKKAITTEVKNYSFKRPIYISIRDCLFLCYHYNLLLLFLALLMHRTGDNSQKDDLVGTGNGTEEHQHLVECQ